MMENDMNSDQRSDVYFLIQKFLSSGLLKKTLKAFNEELEEHNVLPKRIDWEGNEHDRSVDDMVKQFPNIRPDYLLHLCYLATNSTGNTSHSYETGNNRASRSTSFLSFRPKIFIDNKTLTNFRQYFNYLTRSHLAPIHNIDAPFNIVNSLRGREVSGPFSRQRAVTPKIYSSLQIQRTTVGHLSAVYCLLFDHSGKYIMTGADDLLIKLWSAHTGKLIAAFRGASSELTDIAINSENTLLAAGSIDRIIRVWNLQTGSPVAVLTGHNGMITSVNFCPTPCWGVRYLISTSTDGSIAFWTYTYDSGIKVEFRKTPILYQEKIRPGQAQMICSSFSPGGTFLATGSADHHVRVYYMKGDEGPHRILEMEAHSDRVDSIQWAHCGLKFLSGSKDGMAIIWWFERQQWKSIHLDMSAKLPSATNASETDTKKLKVTMVCWNKSDSWVVTAVSDYTLKIWTASKGQLIKVLPGHSDEIYVLEGHPCDNNIILSAGHDGQLFVWDILKGEIVFRFLNTIEGQGFGALFDVKWSPDGCMIAASDSHGHILTFGFGNGSPLLEQLPKELFFHTDYRPLVRDSDHYVLDEQTQIPPHLMPPPFLVDIDGNPYPPMLQRLVPGREHCNVEQLVPNIVIGNEGTQEVIQHLPQNHVLGLDGDEDIRAPGFRLGRRYSNRDHERIRHSTGDWQSDPNIEWKNNVLVPSLRKSVLDRARQVREALKNAELEEYQKQLRQRPHMISINTSSNIKKKDEKKKKNAKYATRSFKTYEYREEEPESSGNENYSDSSGYSDWIAEEKPERPKRSNRRPNTNHVRYSEEEDDDEEDDDYENDHDYGEGPSSSRGRENNVNRKKENNVIKHKENNISRTKVNNTTNDTLNNRDMSSDEEDNDNTTTENHLGKAKLIIRLSKTTADNTYTAIPSTSAIHPNSKLKVSEQYRLSEWLSETRPRKSPYYPQLGDEIVYFMQGHQIYLNMVEVKKTYEISIKELPWNKMPIRDHEFVKVIGIQYEIKPPRLCCLKLALLDEDGRLTGKVFTVKYHDMPDVLDFFVLKQMYITALSRNWQNEDKFRCMIDDEWWIGQIMNKSPAIENFPESVFLCYDIKWTNGERERMSPWDMEPIDPERVPEDENQAVPVLEEELASILYKTVECDWPYNDLSTITTHVVTGITKVMELAIAEPFLVPVDINDYPEYAMFIEYPIDLSTIKARFENNFYRRLTAAQFDIRYLATNAEKFNLKHSAIVKQSRIVTELCLRIVKCCSDYIDVPGLYRRLVDTYNSCDSEEELDVPTPSTSKNIRTLSKRIKRHPHDWKAEAINILESLWKSKDSEPFREPVDPQSYPDYYNIVKNPMDLGSLRENLENSKYDVPQQFIIDMRLIFQNSRLYTPNKKSMIYDMTVRLSELFEEHAKTLMSNWRTARRQNRKKSGSSDDNDSSSSSSSDIDVLSKLAGVSQEEADSETDDDLPLNILRSKTNTESDTTSQSTFSRHVKSKKRNAGSEDEYSPSAEYSRSSRKTKYKSSSSEEEDVDKYSSSSDEDGSYERKCNLRQRPVRKKVLLYESSDSETTPHRNKRTKRVKKNIDSDSDSKSSHNTSNSLNNEGVFMSNVSSRGRIRKLTARAIAMFKKR